MAFSFVSREYTKKFHPDDRRCCRIECVCACSGILFFLPLVSVPESRFGRYWANQGLLILLIEIVALLAWGLSSWILGLLALIPIIGLIFTVIKVAVRILISIAVLFFAIRSGIFAGKRRAVDIPFIGYLRFIK